MKKTGGIIAFCLVLTMIATAVLPFGIMTVNADGEYTVNFFDTVDSASSVSKKYKAYSNGQYEFNDTMFADSIGYGGALAFPADGEKKGIQIILDSTVTAESGKYMEIEYDIAEIKTGTSGSQYKIGFNGSTSAEFMTVLDDGRASITNSSGYVTSSISADDRSNYHRYKFTFKTVSSDDKLIWRLISLKRDGTEALSDGYDNAKFGSAITTIHFRRGATVTDTTTYFDNISVVTYFSESGTSPVPDKYSLLSNIKTSYENAGKKLDAGVINNDVYNNIMNRINTALGVFKSSASTGYDSALNRLTTIDSMLSAYETMKTDGTKIFVDSKNASVSKDTLGTATVSVPVYSSDLSESDLVKTMTLVYQKDDELYSGKLLDILTSEKEISANKDEVITTDVNLASYGSEDTLYLKVVPVFEYDDIASNLIDTVDFYKPQDPEIGPEFSFIGEVGVSKTILNDDPATEDFKITFTMKGNTEEAGKSVSILVIKPNKTVSNIKTNPKDAIEYYGTATLNAEGKAVFEFVPQGGQGYYSYIVLKGNNKISDDIFFASFDDINNVFTKLYGDKSVENLSSDDLAAVSLNSSAYTDAEPAGVDVDKVLNEVLAEKTYDARSLGEFSSSFLTKLKIVTTLRNATSADEVMQLVTNKDYAAHLTSVAQIESLSSAKKRQTAYENIFKGKSSAVDIATTNSLIKNVVKDIKGNEGGGGVVVSSVKQPVVTGGFTATTNDVNKNEETKKETVMEQAEKKFDDIESVEWAKTAIMSFAANGWISGKADGKFAPNDNITREEFIKIVVNVFGFYNKDAKCDFSDSNENDWHYPYIGSAVSNGIVNGVSDDRFGTGSNITREDMAVIIYRIANIKKLPLTIDGEYLGYADEEFISDYAKEAVTELSKSGVINGTDNDCFSPKGFAIRAEAVKMVYEAYNLK